MNTQQNQQVFRTLLNAMSAPGKTFAFGATEWSDCLSSAPLSPACAAICLSLLDRTSPVSLFQMPASVAPWLLKHCRVPISSPEHAIFALGLGKHWDWDQNLLNIGTEEEPEKGVTLILELDSLDGGEPLQLTGPGIATSQIAAPRLSPGFLTFWHQLQGLYPRGIDLILCCGNECLCLPRSISIHADREN
ncbi:phosphonate C-P lyase system protein PhnH [Acidithiobacillus concretivorus]|uniref:Phosphonate C-P lyase system protein PhnH n=1 Tax=Acidithiobacillus concretivorus TaxID=3063952 RepID=A0ABS5ZQJ5_9PROT|nr:phosphonate C-P lyase system protein PhnH [Acidithiobacillus concretivorus]MBU2738898.1 phosphonate C-P lyase system protein PhnH [Acidithiobacillus concretivorus]